MYEIIDVQLPFLPCAKTHYVRTIIIDDAIDDEIQFSFFCFFFSVPSSSFVFICHQLIFSKVMAIVQNIQRTVPPAIFVNVKLHSQKYKFTYKSGS